MGVGAAAAVITSEVKYKFLGVELKRVDDDSKVITFRGTTPKRDRDGDEVIPEGVDLKAFRKNPLFLWAHDWHGQRLPIGRSLEERVIAGEGIEFDIQFDAEDPFAMEVFRKYKAGFLNAVSIGFLPLEGGMEPITDDAGNQLRGTRYNKWEMLELSGVPIPASRDALAILRALGMIDKDLTVIPASLVGLFAKAEEVDEEKGELVAEDVMTMELLRELCKWTKEDLMEYRAIKELMGDAEWKRGAVLNRKNRQLLEDAARDMTRVAASIKEVLASAEKPEEDDSEGDDGTKGALVAEQTPTEKGADEVLPVVEVTGVSASRIRELTLEAIQRRLDYLSGKVVRQ